MLLTLIHWRGSTRKQIYNFTLPTRIGLYPTIDYHLSRDLPIRNSLNDGHFQAYILIVIFDGDRGIEPLFQAWIA